MVAAELRVPVPQYPTLSSSNIVLKVRAREANEIFFRELSSVCVLHLMLFLFRSTARYFGSCMAKVMVFSWESCVLVLGKYDLHWFCSFVYAKSTCLASQGNHLSVLFSVLYWHLVLLVDSVLCDRSCLAEDGLLCFRKCHKQIDNEVEEEKDELLHNVTTPSCAFLFGTNKSGALHQNVLCNFVEFAEGVLQEMSRAD